MVENGSSKLENTALVQVFYLLMMALGGLFLFALIGFLAVYIFYGMAGLKGVLVSDFSYIGAYRIVLTAQQFGLFLTPAIGLAIIEGKKLDGFYELQIPKAKWLGLVAVISVCWMPILGMVNEWNQQLVFPDFLKGVELWMRQMENEAARVTKEILKMNSVNDLLINLFVIAIVPAICEEFIFRGALQRVVFRLKSNPHVAIWLSAIIFSAIHFQFYGFLPRMLLGAAFGYICFWSGSIWYAVFAHFLNNGYAVCVAFYLQSKSQPYANAEEMDMPWFGYIISAILTLALFNFFKVLTYKKKEVQSLS